MVLTFIRNAAVVATMDDAGSVIAGDKWNQRDMLIFGLSLSSRSTHSLDPMPSRTWLKLRAYSKPRASPRRRLNDPS